MLLFNIFELRLCLIRYQVKNQIGTIRFSGSFVRMNQALVCTYLIKPTQSNFLGVLFPSILSGWSTTTGIDCRVFPKDTTTHYYRLENRTTVSSLSQRSTTAYRHRFFSGQNIF